MYNFYAVFLFKIVYLVVLLDFEDIMTACNFWIVDTVLYALWSVSTVHKGLFQPFNATINPKQAPELVVCLFWSQNLFYIFLVSRNEVKRPYLFVLNLGPDPVDQQKSGEDCLVLFYKYSNLYTVQTIWFVLYNQIYPTIRQLA